MDDNDFAPLAPVEPGTQCVCGRSIPGDPTSFNQASYRQATLYFCTEYCLQAFQADPERFYAAHSKTASQRRLEKQS